MGTNPSWHAPTGGGRDVLGDGDTSRFPVDNVSWEAAAEFCRKLSDLPDERTAKLRYRLPTEAEWERACRAGETDPLPLVTKWDEQPVNGEIASKYAPPQPLYTVPVGSYSANAFGLCDMCGNVYEWVSDFRAQGYYPSARTTDPAGPVHGYLHVIRGWHWVATGPECKTYVTVEPGRGNRFVGFRVVCEPYDQELLATKR
jgi:formylglycine-generating enzyme required for sulfatase activity